MIARTEPWKIYFYIGLLLKILLGAGLASHFLTDFFTGFVNYFITSNFENPYQFVVETNLEQFFPYPALMLYVLTLPKILLNTFITGDAGTSMVNMLAFRIPLLIADIGIFLVLKSWLESRVMKVVLFYWLSPVLIYISYVHGQLDVIPVAFLFVSLFFLFREKFFTAAVLLGLAFSVKTNIILVYPFFFLYLYSKDAKIRDLLVFTLIPVAVFLLINLPYTFDPAFFQAVFRNHEQFKVFESYITINNAVIYIIPASIFLLFLKGVLIQHYNRSIFIMFLGFAFGIILLFIPPMPGWYFWLLPFLAYFYIKEKGRAPLLFFGLQFLYLCYFAITKDSDYFDVFQAIAPVYASHDNLYSILSKANIDADMAVNVVFTLLQTTLLINCGVIYKKGIKSYSKHKITNAPFLIGIGGDSGAGKTRISTALANVFGLKNVTVLRGDDMHKWQRGNSKWDEFTHLNPKANHLHKEVGILQKLKHRHKVYRRRYEHATGQFTPEYVLKPNNIIIFEGLHPFYLEAQRTTYDLKIFLNPEKQLLSHWKIIRDMEERGHSKEKIMEQIKKREKDSATYIKTQSRYADILIEARASKEINDIGNKDEKIDLHFMVSLSNSVYMEPLVEALEKIIDLEHWYDDKDKQVIIIKNSCSPEQLHSLADNFIPELEEIGVNMSNWSNDTFGILQLLITYYIFTEHSTDD